MIPTDRAITLRLPAELHERTKAQARAEDRSAAQLLRGIARWYLAGMPRDADGHPIVPPAR